MKSQEELVKEMLDSVSERMVENLTASFAQTLTEEINKSISKGLLEGEFYRRVNEDLHQGFREIYKEIKHARGLNGGAAVTSAEDPDQLFSKASDQLDAIMETTRKAAEDIIEIVEKLQDMQATVAKIVRGFESGGVTKEDRSKLAEINQTLGMDLQNIMVSLSFQDLTGQRIKIIVETIRKVEHIVREVVLSTGLMIQAREEEPEKDFDEIEEKAKSEATKLSGPTMDANQGDVDDLLASLGLD